MFQQKSVAVRGNSVLLEEKYVTRLRFRLEIHQKNGQSFEDFFTEIMTKANKNFRPVKPQGRIGDRKNDGFDSVNGIYYQVYAPENPAIKEASAVEKLKKDFIGAYEYWHKIYPIKEYYFVINDKYQGTYPEVERELNEIKNEYKLLK